MRFLNRKHAGILLAKKLAAMPFEKNNTIVIAIPRGGVPLGHEIAKRLDLPLDIILVKKIGSPSYPELAVGFVSENNEIFYNHQLLNELGLNSKDVDHIKDLALIKLQEISFALRAKNQPLNLKGKNIILVDDGIASGATMEAVIQVLKKRMVKNITIASPVASADAALKLHKETNHVVVLNTPHPLYSVGEWYDDFTQVETEQAIKLLKINYSKISNSQSSNNAESKQL